MFDPPFNNICISSGTCVYDSPLRCWKNNEMMSFNVSDHEARMIDILASIHAHFPNLDKQFPGLEIDLDDESGDFIMRIPAKGNKIINFRFYVDEDGSFYPNDRIDDGKYSMAYNCAEFSMYQLDSIARLLCSAWRQIELFASAEMSPVFVGSFSESEMYPLIEWENYAKAYSVQQKIGYNEWIVYQMIQYMIVDTEEGNRHFDTNGIEYPRPDHLIEFIKNA
jgi:hypothetical protein